MKTSDILLQGISQLIGFVLGYSIIGIKQTVLSRIYRYCVVLLVSYLFPVSGFWTLVCIHGYFFEQLPVFRDFRSSVVRLATGDGALNEEMSSVMLNGFVLLTYISTCLICDNLSASWALLRAALNHLLYAFATMSTVITLWFCMVDNPVQSFFAEITPILRRFGRIALYILGTTVRIGIFVYSVLAEVLDQTGLFSDEPSALDGMPEYVYRKLETGRQIRLLALSRRYPFGPVRCRLLHVSLGKAPTYESISYTWGNPDRVKAICVDGRRLAVTANVSEIIRNRAFFWTTRHIWCDAICINQNDEEEKSGQVQLMRTIYRQATRTLIWLGTAPDANEAMGFLAQLFRKMNMYDLDDAELKSILGIGTQSTPWPSLFNLLDHPYWTRVWIIQEIAVGRTVHIYYGGEVITWDMFVQIIRGFYRPNMGSVFVLTELNKIPKSLPIRGKSQILLIADIRDELQKGNPISFRDLLVRAAKGKATDPRDKIFAILGMADEHARQTIEPDYSQSAQDVCLSTSKYLFAYSEPFDVLHQAGIGHRREIFDLPSWAVDWSSPPGSNSLWRTSVNAPYRASGDVEGRVWTVPGTDFAGVTGQCVDELVEFAPAFNAAEAMQGDRDLMEILPSTLAMFRGTRELADIESSRPYVNGQSRREALWRTITGDRLTDTRPAPDIVGEYYAAAERIFIGMAWTIEHPGVDYPDSVLEEIYPGINKQSPQEALARINNDEKASGKFWNASGAAFHGRKFAITKDGYMALVPPLAAAGDVVCIIHGAQTPFILRRDQEQHMGGSAGLNYQLVGDAYVHAMMDGEMVQGGSPVEVFTLR